MLQYFVNNICNFVISRIHRVQSVTLLCLAYRIGAVE